MKIYEIGTGYTPIPAKIGAATEIVVEELTKAFQKKGLDVELLDIQAENRRENDLPIREVRVPGFFAGTDVQLGIMHKLKRVIYSTALARKLKDILNQATEPVLLHFHNQYNLFFFLKLVPAKLRSKCRIAYTNHSYIWHGCWDEIKEVIKKRYFQEVYCLKHADYIFVLNKQTHQNIVNHLRVDKSKVWLIDNGVNTDIYYKISQEEKEYEKKRRGFLGKTVYIQVGSVCERKNQLGALQLLLPFMKSNRNIVFCYAGGVIDAVYQENILNFAKENDIEQQVFYAGELSPGEELNCFYSLAEAMIFPSQAEGFSLVIIEAMSAGIPVFVSKQLRFALEGSCLRFDENDFCEKLQMILDDAEQKKWSQKCRAAVEAQYSWNNVAMDYAKVWGIVPGSNS